MYKIIAVDLDGTLLNSYGVVSESTKNVIQEAIKKGVDVIIASGRSIDSIKTIAKEIGSEKYFIAGNGSLIYDIKNNEIIYEKYLNKQKILQIAEICENNSVSYSVYTEDGIIAKQLKHNVLYYYKENLKKEENKKTNIILTDNIIEYIKNSNNNKFLKVTICDESKMIFSSIIRKLKKISNINVLDVGHMSKKFIKQGTEEIEIQFYYTEISLKDVNKWNAIEYLINRLNIDKDEVITIGDNINDKEMIENAGLGVAMGQSTPKIKEIADYITDDNENEGVKKAIQKLILQ